MLRTNLQLLLDLHAFLLVRVCRLFPKANTTSLKLIFKAHVAICLIPIVKINETLTVTLVFLLHLLLMEL